MPLDPNIILDVNQNPGIQPQQLVSMFDFARQMSQYRQQQEGQNALKKIFSDPSSVDPQTGMPTQNAIRSVMAVDPTAGMNLQNMSLDQQVKRAQMQHAQTEAGTTKFNFMAQVAGAGYDAYDDAKKSGKSEEDAIAAGQAARNAAAKDGGGVVGDDVVDGITGSPFEPNGAKALASTNKEWAGLQHQERADVIGQERIDVDNKRADEQGKRDDAMIGLAAKREDDAGDKAANAKWEILTDPKGNTQYRYNPVTTEATTLDGKPYTPGGAAKLGGSGTPRSPAAMATQKFVEENPNATADDIANFGAKYQRTITAGTADVKAEAAGLQNLGKMKSSVEQAEGNANREADLVLSLAPKGTANGGPSILNKWRQSVSTGIFNDPDVSSFQTSVESLKNEYVKVLSTQGGMSGGMSSDSARREADAYINPNLTEDQLKANIAVMKKSMQNRTAAINSAYSDTQQRVKKAGDGSASNAPNSPPTSKLKSGVNTTFSNGQVWTLDADGNPKQVK